MFVPKTFKSYSNQIWHFLGIPAFFFLFVLLYEPFDVKHYLDTGRDAFAFNITMLFTIAVLSLTITRTAFYFIWRDADISFVSYIGWCLAEVLAFAFFAALYIYLMYRKVDPFFTVLSVAAKYTYLIMVYPYVILSLILLLNSPKTSALVSEDDSLIRFTDESQRLKLTITASSVLFIAAEYNYVRIHYLEAGKVKEYLLRNSMKALEATVTSHGLVRSHRSYYVNPQHITVLRKEKDGVIQAQFDAETVPVPVSKTYYDLLASSL